VADGYVKQFLAAKARQPSAAGGNLGFRPCPGERHDIHFRAAGFIREKSKPVAIGREFAFVFTGRQARGCSRPKRHAPGQRQNPIRVKALLRAQVYGKEFTVARPIDGKTKLVRVIGIDGLFGTAAIERAAADGPLATALDEESVERDVGELLAV